MITESTPAVPESLYDGLLDQITALECALTVVDEVAEDSSTTDGPPKSRLPSAAHQIVRAIEALESISRKLQEHDHLIEKVRAAAGVSP